MDLELIFSLVNTAALVCWIVLLLFYQKRWIYRALFSFVIPGLALVYLFFILKGMSGDDPGGFDTLANVKLLFAREEAVLAGWIHYLVFDLFVGMWICHDSKGRGLNRWVVVPCLLLTFILGPTGLLLYLVIRMIYLKKFPQDPYVENILH